MAVLHDYFCSVCDSEQYDQWSSDPPKCCHKTMSVLLHRVNSNEWGAPRQYIHLRDEPFQSRSEFETWKKKKGYSTSPSAEKSGGARNDMYDNIGKVFSGPGFSKKQNQLYSETPRRIG